MADSKVTALTAETAPVGADLIYLVDDVAGTPTSKKATLTDVAASAPFSGTYAPLSVHYTVPTHGVTRASSTLGSLSTPWTDSVTVAAGEDVEYDISLSSETTTAITLYFALAVDGAIVNSIRCDTIANRQTTFSLGGVVTGLSAGAHTFEVFVATHGAETVTVSSTPTTTTGASLTRDGVSSMRLRVCTAV